jgi:S1-C subfamily serine protease
MAKPSSKFVASRTASPPVLVGYRILKAAAFVLGIPAAQLSLMALIGAVTGNGYARVFGAAAVVVCLPLAIADRLLPSRDPSRAPGLVSDVCAVTWLLLTFGIAGAAGGLTRPLFLKEADWLMAAGHDQIAWGAYALAGAHVEVAPAPEPAASASAVVSIATPPSATAAGPPSASATAVDAGAPRPKTDRPADRTPAELFKEVSPSVVTILAFYSGTGEGGGTGFVIDRDGVIATNHHVIENARRVQVKLQSGVTFDEVELLADAEAVDLALLRVDLSSAKGGRVDVRPLPLANSDDVVVGEHAIVIGNPLGLESTLTDGLISARRVYENRPWIQFSAPISSGNSGGPLINMRGDVIGVTTASLSGAPVTQNLNFAIPINELKKLVRTEYPSRRKFQSTAPASGRW